MSENVKKSTVVEKDGLDDFVFSVIRDGSRVAEICPNEEAEGVVQDVFTSFFSHQPKIGDGPNVQKDIVSAFHSLPEFQDLRACTQSDEVSSAIGVMQFAPELLKQYHEAKKKIEERQKEASEKGQQGPEGLQDGLTDSEQSGMRQALRKALKQAQESADDWQDAVSAWGVNPGELQRIPAEKRLELAEKMGRSKKLKKISDLAGRFQNIVYSAAANAPVHGVDEIVDISIGSEISKILPTELVKLIETPEVFFQDMLEGKLLNYNLKGVQDMGKGPIVACLDISASMTGAREEWSKAVILSLMALAEKQRRAFGFIAFHTDVAFKKFWPRGTSITLEEKVEVAGIASTGGTSFYTPITAAFEMRAAEGGALKPADIILITDGECDLSEPQLNEINATKKREGVRIQSIAINDGQFSMLNTDLLQKFSDQLAVVNNLGDIEILDKVFGKAAGAAMEARYG